MSVILATAGYDHKIRFWEAPSGICSRTLRYPDSQVNCLEITPDKQFVAAGGNPHIRLFAISAGGGTGDNNNGGSGGSNNKNQNNNPVLTLEGHSGSVTSLGFQRDGRYLYSGSEDGTVKLWDLRSPTYSRSFDARSPVNSVALFSNSRGEIISGDQSGHVRAWDLGSGRCSNDLVPEKPPPPSSSSDEIHSSSSSGGPGLGGTTTTVSKGVIASIQAVDVSEDGRMVVAANNRADVFVWDPSSGIIPNISTIPGTGGGGLHTNSLPPTTTATAITTGGNANTTSTTAATAVEGGGGLDLSSIGSGGNGGGAATTTASSSLTTHSTSMSTSSSPLWRPITRFRAHPSGSYLLKAKISPDGRYLVTTGSDHTARLWDTTTWDLCETLARHQKWVWDAVFSADSNYLVTASSDHSARLWNLRSGEVVRQYTGHQTAVTCVALNDSST